MSAAVSGRELLEFAAKAEGLILLQAPNANQTDADWWAYSNTAKPNTAKAWNPLIDDGDAFRLACRLHINVFIYHDETSTATLGVVAKNWGSVEANTRRAIVYAAAEIGKAMP